MNYFSSKTQNLFFSNYKDFETDYLSFIKLKALQLDHQSVNFLSSLISPGYFSANNYHFNQQLGKFRVKVMTKEGQKVDFRFASNGPTYKNSSLVLKTPTVSKFILRL